jgi:hypothetical protein
LAVLSPKIVASREDFLTPRTRRLAPRNAEVNFLCAFASTFAASAFNPAVRQFGCGFAALWLCVYPESFLSHLFGLILICF